MFSTAFHAVFLQSIEVFFLRWESPQKSFVVPRKYESTAYYTAPCKIPLEHREIQHPHPEPHRDNPLLAQQDLDPGSRDHVRYIECANETNSLNSSP